MTPETIRKARAEAREFDRRAKELLDAYEAEGNAWMRVVGGRLSGSLRRQSMELTRALAEMRRGPR